LFLQLWRTGRKIGKKDRRDHNRSESIA
jgi:hypothetical protein